MTHYQLNHAPLRLVAKSDIIVNVSVEDAYHYVRSFENMHQWFPGVASIRSIPPAVPLLNDALKNEPYAPATQYVEKVVIPMIGECQVPLQVVFEERYVKIVLDGYNPSMMPRSTMIFEILDEHRCKLHWSMSSRRDGNCIWRAIFRFVQIVMLRRGTKALRNLKAKLEFSSQQS